jgi:hypothetical protein
MLKNIYWFKFTYRKAKILIKPPHAAYNTNSSTFKWSAGTNDTQYFSMLDQ